MHFHSSCIVVVHVLLWNMRCHSRYIVIVHALSWDIIFIAHIFSRNVYFQSICIVNMYCRIRRIFVVHVPASKTQVSMRIKRFVVHSLCYKGFRAFSGEERWFWGTCVDTQADFGIRWALMQFCRKCCVQTNNIDVEINLVFILLAFAATVRPEYKQSHDYKYDSLYFVCLQRTTWS